MFKQYFGTVDSGRYEVGPLYVSNRDGGYEFVDEPLRLEDAEFWGVCKQEPDELWTWVRDFPSKEEAVRFVHEEIERHKAAQSALFTRAYSGCSGALAV